MRMAMALCSMPKFFDPRRSSPGLVLQSSELSNGIGELLGIGILLESHNSAVGHTPDMSELRADFSTAFFVPAAVSAEHHDVIPGIQPFFRHHLEIRPFRSKSHENSFEHRLWAAIRTTIGVDEVFRLAPLDMLVHLAKHRNNIALAERLVHAANHRHILL